MKINSIVLALLVLATVFTGCKKEEEQPVLPPENEHNHYDVALKFTPVIAGNEVEIGTTYTVNGVDMTFSRMQFYVHDITFYPSHEMADGQTLSGNYLLVGADNDYFELGDIEMNHVHMLSFKIGVDVVANAQSEQEFLARPASDPLSPQSPSMHWSWAAGSGYKFWVFEGELGNGEEFVYHGAKDALLRDTGMMTVHQNMNSEDINELNIKLNLSAVFNGVDVEASPVVHGDGAINVTLSDNLSGAFSVMP